MSPQIHIFSLQKLATLCKMYLFYFFQFCEKQLSLGSEKFLEEYVKVLYAHTKAHTTSYTVTALTYLQLLACY